MTVNISSDAEVDLADGYWFYELQERGLGNYFRSSMMSDIESLLIHGGVHPIVAGHHRMLCKTFPYSIYYRVDAPDSLTIMAVLGQRQDPKLIQDRLK